MYLTVHFRDDTERKRTFFGQVQLTEELWKKASEDELRKAAQTETAGLADDLLNHIVKEWRKQQEEAA